MSRLSLLVARAKPSANLGPAAMNESLLATLRVDLIDARPSTDRWKATLDALCPSWDKAAIWETNIFLLSNFRDLRSAKLIDSLERV